MWSRTGLKPYSHEVIVRRCCKLVGDNSTVACQESHCASVVGGVLDSVAPYNPPRKCKACIQGRVAYNLDNMEELAEERARSEVEKKKLKRLQREERCRRKREEREAREAEKRRNAACWKQQCKEAKSKEVAAKCRRAEDRACKAEERQAAIRAKAEVRARNTCVSCSAVWCGGQGWKGCARWEKCRFMQCPKCWRMRPDKLLDHELGCKQEI